MTHKYTHSSAVSVLTRQKTDYGHPQHCHDLENQEADRGGGEGGVDDIRVSTEEYALPDFNITIGGEVRPLQETCVSGNVYSGAFDKGPSEIKDSLCTKDNYWFFCVYI